MTTIHRSVYGLGKKPFPATAWSELLYGLGWGNGIPKSAFYYVNEDHVVMRGSRWRMAQGYGAMYHYPLEIFERIWRRVAPKILAAEKSNLPVPILTTKSHIRRLAILCDSGEHGYSNGAIAEIFEDVIGEAFDRKQKYCDCEPVRFGSTDHFHKHAVDVVEKTTGFEKRKQLLFFQNGNTVFCANVDALSKFKRKAVVSLLSQIWDGGIKYKDIHKRERWAKKQFGKSDVIGALDSKYRSLADEIYTSDFPTPIEVELAPLTRRDMTRQGTDRRGRQ